jgi:uncharacterized protein (DUF58 family)
MLLDAHLLSKLSGVKVRARAVVEGVLSGLHKSPHQGQSVEFAEHKEYAPGDELKHLDWKAYGKFDRFYVKRFEHETNLRATMVVDSSGSMGFSSGALSKLEVAKILAAALSHLLIRQQDAAGLTLVAENLFQEIPPRSAATHLTALLETLEVTQAQGKTRLGASAQLLAEKLKARSLVCVFSDFFDDDETALKRLLALKSQKHDLVFFHVVDRAELEFPYEDSTRFLSMEDTQSIEIHPREIRESYLQEFNLFLQNTKQQCQALDCEYIRVCTDESLEQVCLQFLAGRGGRR